MKLVQCALAILFAAQAGCSLPPVPELDTSDASTTGGSGGNVVGGDSSFFGSDADHSKLDGAIKADGGSSNLVCSTGLSPCGDACVNLATDNKNCGACGVVADLANDSKNCGACGNVVDTSADPANCGKCGKVCSAHCLMGLCCSAGEVVCQGACVNSKTDATNCGTCGMKCQAGKFCSDGLCVNDCGTKSTCGTSCVDTKTDPDNCGACSVAGDHQCKPPIGGSRSCSGGVCQSSCGTATNCSETCVDLTKDAAHCGKCTMACTGGQICQNGVCCSAGQSNCSSGCADLSSDPQNCGTCGKSCNGNGCCGGGCVDLQNDNNNCGVCGKSCGTGSCCGGACVDLQSDRNNCGVCGKFCTGAANGDAMCNTSACQYTCRAGTHICGTTCYDNTDPAHCGMGCAGCGQGSICANAVCTACPAGMVSVSAGNFCIDAVEVTNTAYAAFLAKGPSLAGQPARCAFNTTYVPSAAWPATGSKPVTWVDWCDAYAYCRSMGRRLCGAIGGGPSPTFNDPKTSQWFAACTAGGTRTYPYGATYQATTCNGFGYGAGASLNVGALSACVGGSPGLYDMSGNVIEWEDGCYDAGDGTWCRVRGGSFNWDTPYLACDSNISDHPETARVDTGFRCCSEP